MNQQDPTEHCNKAVLSKNPAKIKEKIADNLTKMLRAGPEVSFKGSPMVSPITAALCSSVPFPLVYPSLEEMKCPASMYFLALSQAPPELAEEIAIDTPEIKIPGNTPATQVGPKKHPAMKGVPNTMKAGKNISFKEDSVAMLIHYS